MKQGRKVFYLACSALLLLGVLYSMLYQLKLRGMDAAQFANRYGLAEALLARPLSCFAGTVLVVGLLLSVLSKSPSPRAGKCLLILGTAILLLYAVLALILLFGGNTGDSFQLVVLYPIAFAVPGCLIGIGITTERKKA